MVTGRATSGHRYAWWAILLMATITSPGCGAKFPLVPVTGTVMLDGQPLAGAFVIFAPVEPSPGSLRVATGMTDANGRFTLRTNYEPRWTGMGAVPGTHRVTISKVVAAQDLPRAIYAEKLAQHTKRMRDMGMRPGSPGDDVDRFGVELVPAKYLAMATTPLSAEVTPDGTNDVTFDLE